ncbi:MAG: GPR endopeptidase [Clostridia bacterium]|nr:GPR endopeptidase [Clostridia bacterium]
MNLRTDLAVERREIVGSDHIDGVVLKEYEEKGVKVTEISVTDESGSKALGKPIGEYITLEVTPFTRMADVFSSQLDVVSDHIGKLLPEEGTVLVIGLGNDSITPDAFGPLVVKSVLATRHIDAELQKNIGFEDMRRVAAVATGVLGKTGVESGEIAESLVRKIKPSAVIAVDALAARRLERLGTTVQMSSSGITPGSGVGNARFALNSKTLGVPVISIGVPTVVDGSTLAYDIIEKAGIDERHITEDILRPFGQGIIVTPEEVDLMVERAALLVAMGINSALQRFMDPKDILAIVS